MPDLRPVTRRRQRAKIALGQYAVLLGDERADRATTLTDLLADCMHLVGGDEFASCLDSARAHYAAEVDES